MNGLSRTSRSRWQVQTTPAWSEVVRDTSPDEIMEWKATSDFHAKQGRSTGHINIQGGALSCYLKRHWSLPWLSRIGAWCFPQRCWTPAAVEWTNLHWAQSMGISVPEPLALGVRVGPGLELRSFLAIRELSGMLALHQAIPLAQSIMNGTQFVTWKGRVLAQVAQIARRLHGLDRYHKDLYLCHFYVTRPQATMQNSGPLTVIDLHRLGHHRLGSWRWLVKDLAQLYFSTWGVAGLNDDDRMFLFQHYLGHFPREGEVPAELRAHGSSAGASPSQLASSPTGLWTARQRMLYQAVVFKARRYARHNGITTESTPESGRTKTSGLAA